MSETPKDGLLSPNTHSNAGMAPAGDTPATFPPISTSKPTTTSSPHGVRKGEVGGTVQSGGRRKKRRKSKRPAIEPITTDSAKPAAEGTSEPTKPTKPGEVEISTPQIRRQKYVQGLAQGKTKAAAARDAGFAATTANHAKEKIDCKPEVQSAFKDLLEQVEVTDLLLARRIREGLDAMETKFWQRKWPVVFEYPEGANPIAAEPDHTSDESGELIRRDLIAFGERRAWVELAIKLKGLQPASEHKVTHSIEDLLAASWDAAVEGGDA